MYKRCVFLLTSRPLLVSIFCFVYTPHTRVRTRCIHTKHVCLGKHAQCLQVYGFIRILYEIIAANTENKIENTEKIASAACVLAAILYKIQICTPKVLKFWVEIMD